MKQYFILLSLVAIAISEPVSLVAVTSIKEDKFEVTYFRDDVRTVISVGHKFANPKRPILDSFFMYHANIYFVIANKEPVVFAFHPNGTHQVIKTSGVFQSIAYNIQIGIIGSWVPITGGNATLVAVDPRDFSVFEMIAQNLPLYTRKARASALSEEAVFIASSDEGNKPIVEIYRYRQYLKTVNSTCGYYWSLFYQTQFTVYGTVSKQDKAPTDLVAVKSDGTCELLVADLEKVIKAEYGEGHFQLAGYYEFGADPHLVAFDAKKKAWYLLRANIRGEKAVLVKEFHDVALHFAKLVPH
jgi:hypothetical protein